jgi:hypothetical protein
MYCADCGGKIDECNESQPVCARCGCPEFTDDPSRRLRDAFSEDLEEDFREDLPGDDSSISMEGVTDE